MRKGKGEQNIKEEGKGREGEVPHKCVFYQIPVPAPGVALVFISSNAQGVTDPTTTQTYSTTAVTKLKNTVTIDPSVLATSNGDSAKDRAAGSTSQGSSDAPRTAGVAPGLTMLAMFVTGVWVVVAAMRR